MGFETINITTGKEGQAIRIPKRLEIKDDKVYLRKVGNVLYIIPFHDPWQNFIESLDAFTPDFMDDRQQPDNQIRESLD